MLCDEDIPSPLLRVAGEGHTDLPGLLWPVVVVREHSHLLDSLILADSQVQVSLSSGAPGERSGDSRVIPPLSEARLVQ